MNVDTIEKIKFEIHGDDRGSLVSFEKLNLPLELRRVFFMYDTKEGIHRGVHAHKTTNEFLVCTAGSCKVILDDGSRKRAYELNRPDEGLYVPADVWREMYDFSKDAVLMAVADTAYDEKDYIRDYREFLEYYHRN